MLTKILSIDLSSVPVMFWVILSFILSGIISFLIIPPIIQTARRNKVLDTPNKRTSHNTPTPRLGGIAIFFSLLITLAVCDELIWEVGYHTSLYVALFIIFLTGALDDFTNLNPWKKLLAQFLVAGIIIFGMDISINNLYGLAGIEEIPIYISSALTALVIIVIINAFNLIDGINGLSGSMTILTSAIFGIWFFLIGEYIYSVLACALVGATISFLYFNWSPSKIFLGDSGSLLNGTIVSILFIAFLNQHQYLPDELVWKVDASPVVAISILMIPLFDTFRVFIVRILSGKSPLSPDRNHIHHILIDAGYSHSQATLVLLFINIVFVLAAFGLNFIGSIALYMLIITMLSIIASLFAYIRVRNRQRAS